jgi:hypothetical protein
MKKWVFAVMAAVLVLSAFAGGCGKKKYSLTINVIGQGTTVPASGSRTYNEGTIVEISAIPAASDNQSMQETWRVDDWSGDASGVDATISVTMDGDKSVTARFSATVSPLDAKITVSAGQYYDVPIHLRDMMHDVALSGSFTASGGSGNDVEVFILSQADFTNWQNGHSYSALYSSGRVTTATFNVSLPTPSAGQTSDYHVIYSNTFSWISTKQVNTTVDLNWY